MNQEDCPTSNSSQHYFKPLTSFDLVRPSAEIRALFEEVGKGSSVRSSRDRPTCMVRLFGAGLLSKLPHSIELEAGWMPTGVRLGLDEAFFSSRPALLWEHLLEKSGSAQPGRSCPELKGTLRGGASTRGDGCPLMTLPSQSRASWGASSARRVCPSSARRPQAISRWKSVTANEGTRGSVTASNGATELVHGTLTLDT